MPVPAAGRQCQFTVVSKISFERLISSISNTQLGRVMLKALAQSPDTPVVINPNFTFVVSEQ